MYTLFVGQSLFGAKLALVRGGVPLARTHEFAHRVHECWNALAGTLSEDERKDAPAVALWIFSPILDKNHNSDPELELTTEDRLTWWRALYNVAVSIVRDGPSREVGWLFHVMAGSPVVQAFQQSDYVELLEALQTRTRTLDRASLGYHWADALSSASEVIEALAQNEQETATVDLLYRIVSDWAAPPLSVERAGAAARQIRG